MQIKKSKILDGYSLAIVYPEDEQYELLEPLFKTYGLAVTETRSNVIYVDGKGFDENNYDNSHLEAIDAHEIAHIILRHGGENINQQEEIEADYFAILLLNALNNKESAKLLMDDFEGRHKESYNTVEKIIRPEILEIINNFMVKNFGVPELVNEVDAMVDEFFNILAEEKINNSKIRLVEGRVDDAKNVADSLGIDDELFKTLVEASGLISSNHKYLNWIIKMVASGNQDTIEDDILNPLKFFASHTAEFATKDINSYDNLEEFQKAVQEVESKQRREIDEIIPGEKVLENDKFIVVAPGTIDSSCSYGAGTTWCTTMKDQTYFNDYTKKGQLYYILSKIKPTSDVTNKIAIRFLFEKGSTGFKIAEIRDTKNTNLSYDEFIELVGEDTYRKIVEDLGKRREMDVDKFSYDKLLKHYQENPANVLNALGFEDLLSFLRSAGIVDAHPELCELLLKYGINPISKTDLNLTSYYYMLVNKTADVGGTIVKIVDDYMEIRKTDLYTTFSNMSSVTTNRDEFIRLYFETKYPNDWVEELLIFLFPLMNDSIYLMDLPSALTSGNIDPVQFYEKTKGLSGFFTLLKLQAPRYFERMITTNRTEESALRLYISSAIKSGKDTIMTVYDLLQKYKNEGYDDIDFFKILGPHDMTLGFTDSYGDEGVDKLVSFLIKNNIDIFEYLEIGALNTYYGGLNETITAAIKYYNEIDDVNTLWEFLDKKFTLNELIDYFKVTKNLDDLDALAEVLALYNYSSWFNSHSASDLSDFDVADLMDVFDKLGMLYDFENEFGEIKVFLGFVAKAEKKDIDPELKLRYKRNAFDTFGAKDVRMNEDGSVDLICDGWSDFVDWFASGGRDTDYQYIAKQVLGEDDIFEPYYDVVSDRDWYDSVWDIANKETIQYVRNYIKEKFLLSGATLTIDTREIADYIPEEWVNEDDDEIELTAERLDEISDDGIGHMIEEIDDFDDLKDEMKYAYGDAYNSAARHGYYEAYTDAILKTLGGGNPRWEATGKKIVHKYKSDGEEKSYESNEERFVIPDISFFEWVTNWANDNKDYNDEFQYGSFIDTVGNQLSEQGDPLSPHVNDWPDSDDVEKDFNEIVTDRF